MKGYLGLVSEYAKVHKKKNRLTIICIAISVMLVTAIFGMADMSLKAQKEEAIRRYGNWHTIISNIPLETADAISNRKDVSVSGFLGMASSTNLAGKRIDYPKQQRGTCETNEFISYRGALPCFGNGSIVRQAGLGAIRAVYWRYD